MIIRLRIVILLITMMLTASWTSVAQATEAYEFANTVINSLEQVRTITGKPLNHKPTTTVDDSLNALSDEMHTFIQMKTEIKEAAFPLEQYKKSPDENISKSADILIGAYEIFNKNLEVAISNIEKILNDPKIVMEKQGTTKRDVYQLQTNMDEAWSFLAKAAGTVALATEDQDRLVDGKVHYLKITSAERQQLQQLLVKDFGPSVKEPDKATNDTFPARILWLFLTSDKWVNADDK